MAAIGTERVLDVRHWNDTLFSFKTTRDSALRFRNGHFVMIGLPADEGRPLMRAYSIASANYEDHLEFFSIKVENGPLTSRLQHLKPGDDIVVSRKPTGSLLLDDLLPPGGHLLAFGGDRTFHKLVTAIEEAGFEIRGTIAWIFGQGFPKSLNVSRKLKNSLPADAQCAYRRRTAGLIIGQTMGGGKERRVLVLEVLKQGLPLSSYRQRHRNHAASLRLRSGCACSNDLTRRCTVPRLWIGESGVNTRLFAVRVT